jgi:glycosyltransferase involved in cell wall biosynthesis
MSSQADRRTSASALRALRNVPLATTVAARHLARSSEHVAGLLHPWWGGPDHRAALEAMAAGDLMRARALADRAGTAGRLLARYLDGELAVLDPIAVGDPGPLRHGPVPGVDGEDRVSVLHLVSNALPETVAGYTLRTHGIARAQVRAGHQVGVATRLGFPVTQGHLSAAPGTTVDGVHHHRLVRGRLPFRADDALRLDIERTGALVARFRPAVLHAHSNHVNGQVALALRRRYGLPVVYEVRGMLEETWRSRTDDPGAAHADRYRLTRAAETRVMRAADAVVALSETMAGAIRARGVPAERVHVVPNCVEDSWLADPPCGTDRPFTVGFVGTLNDYEGVHVLVDAVGLLRREGWDVRLLVVGDGPARTDLEKGAADRGIADAATFTGRLPHDAVRAAHEQVDVFCLPRLDLPVTRLVPPLKPLEAMALGRPVIASDLPPLRELVGADRGVLVAPCDPLPLAAAIADLTEPAVRHRLGAAAREWVTHSRTWSIAAARYQQIYALTQGETP